MRTVWGVVVVYFLMMITSRNRLALAWVVSRVGAFCVSGLPICSPATEYMIPHDSHTSTVASDVHISYTIVTRIFAM